MDPVPSDSQLTQFYESKYFDLIRQGGRAPHIARLIATGRAADRERKWLNATTYADVGHLLRTHAPGKRVLDIGCGTGDLVDALATQGLDAQGVEPSVEAAEEGRRRGLSVEPGTLADYEANFREEGRQPFHGIVLLNVLEHVPDPRKVLDAVGRLLVDGGVVVVQVPNDFSLLQKAAHRKLGGAAWWIAIPDHINYFDRKSLESLMRGRALEPVYAQADFPMELFLLMGRNYVGAPEVGAQCHADRVRFELALAPEERRRVYRAFGAAGIGRDILMAATKGFE